MDWIVRAFWEVYISGSEKARGDEIEQPGGV